MHAIYVLTVLHGGEFGLQVHKLLQGLPPIRSLVAVGSGAAKLVTLPLMNYRKDKRLLKGIQRGTNTTVKLILASINYCLAESLEILYLMFTRYSCLP